MADTTLDRAEIPDLDAALRDRWGVVEPPPPVFIMGLHRSGTTILYEFLRRTLPVAPLTVGDVVFYPRLVHSHLEDGGRNDRRLLEEYFESHGIERRALDAISLSPDTVEEYGWILVREAGSFRVNDRTRPTLVDLTRKLAFLRPDARALLLKNPWDTPIAPEIAAAFPDARFVFLRRDPVEILNSELRNQLAFSSRKSPLVKLLMRGTPRLQAALGAARVARRVLGRRLSERLLLWWILKDVVNGLEGYRAALEGVPAHRTVQVGYGELVEDTPGTLRRVADFLGLPLSAKAAELEARRRSGGLLPAVAEREAELRERLRGEGLGWALGA